MIYILKEWHNKKMNITKEKWNISYIIYFSMFYHKEKSIPPNMFFFLGLKTRFVQSTIKKVSKIKC